MTVMDIARMVVLHHRPTRVEWCQGIGGEAGVHFLL